MAAPTFDLQSHSTWSDGALPPREVVARAREAGVELLALTDHDTVDGVDEALEAAARQGLRVVPALELSALHGEREDLHILGYLVEHRSAALAAALTAFRDDRARRVARMADALREVGFALEPPHRGDAPVGRPHLAQTVVEHPANAMRLREEAILNASQLLEAYLVPGAPAYRRRTTPTVAHAIEVIHEAGGVAVWAHPFWSQEADASVLNTVDRFVPLGLDGVEAFYPSYTAEQTRLLADHAARHRLLITGSADFHGPQHPVFHAFRAFELHGPAPQLGPIGAL